VGRGDAHRHERKDRMLQRRLASLNNSQQLLDHGQAPGQLDEARRQR
jgi:hypothetical protein